MQHRLVQQPVLHVGIRDPGGIAHRSRSTVRLFADIPNHKTAAVIMQNKRGGGLGFRQPQVQYLPLILSVRDQLVIRLLGLNRFLCLRPAKRSHG